MITTASLTYVAESLTFVSELSSFRDVPMVRVYPDALDLGFVLISERTRREVVMVEDHREEKDGELLWIDYVPAHREDKALGIKVRLFND